MKLYSNEIVFRGHPDKVCDQISDALLDAYLSGDKASRCGIEVAGGKGKIFITGEVTSNSEVNVEEVVKRVLADVGYSTDYDIINNLGTQSQDIALGTNEEVGGAGDQGMMFGYACDDTSELLPTAMVILQKLSRWYDELRKNDKRFKPDGKAQITGYYDENMKLQKIKTFTVSYQNTEEDRVKTDLIIIDKCLEIALEYGIKIERFLINPTGKFEVGGFEVIYPNGFETAEAAAQAAAKNGDVDAANAEKAKAEAAKQAAVEEQRKADAAKAKGSCPRGRARSRGCTYRRERKRVRT